MDDRMREGFSLVVVLSIAAASLLVASVTFGVLESSGQVADSTRSLGGAVVGFLASFSIISLTYSRLLRLQSTAINRGLQDRNSTLSRQVEELSQQLIRGAERPSGYDIEVLDQHRIVMARPREYTSRGGVIVDLEQPDDPGAEDGTIDLVPARLFVKYIPAPEGTTVAQYYRDYAERAGNSALVEMMACERTVVGADMRAVPSLRVTSQGVMAVTVKRDPTTKTVKRHTRLIPRSSWDQITESEEPRITLPPDEDDTGTSHTFHLRVRLANVVCLHPDLEKVFFFGFEDDEDDFVDSVEALNRSLRSVRFLT